jgi:hypothetical protein
MRTGPPDPPAIVIDRECDAREKSEVAAHKESATQTYN